MIATVDVTAIRIETERLILRPWQENDLADFYEYAKVDGVGQMAGWKPHESLDESRVILDMFIREKKTLALELKENGKVIGSVGLEEPRPHPDGLEDSFGREIGYALSKDHWGRGLMTEAVKAVIGCCFRELNMDWLSCGHFEANHRSRRVIEKCGFRYIKDFVYKTQLGTKESSRLYILHNEDKIFLQMNAPFDVTLHKLETERLILRPLEEGDLMAYHALSCFPEVAEFSGWECSKTIDDTRKRLNRHLEEKETFALVLKETGEFIGTFSLQARNWPDYPVNRSFKGREFGFDLHPKYWGRGLMPEAVRAVTDLCFEKLGFDFVSAGHFPGNERSARVIEKCGFAYLFTYDVPLTETKTVPASTFIRC